MVVLNVMFYKSKIRIVFLFFTALVIAYCLASAPKSFANDASHIAPKSLVIIEILNKQKKEFCLGFLLNEYDVMTASRCAGAGYENMKVYRSLQDCNARKNSIPIEAGNYTQSEPLEPTTLPLKVPINDRALAVTSFPVIDRDEDLNCFFLIKNNHQLSLFRRRVHYWDTVKNRIIKVTTPSTIFHTGHIIPGAILFSSVGDVTGISFENGQLYSPMHGFLIPFYTVALEPYREL